MNDFHGLSVGKCTLASATACYAMNAKGHEAMRNCQCSESLVP